MHLLSHQKRAEQKHTSFKINNITVNFAIPLYCLCVLCAVDHLNMTVTCILCLGNFDI